MSNPYVSFTWEDRDSEFPTRRILSYIDPNTQQTVTLQVTVSRDEGTITVVGTPFAATYMNALESRINAAFASLTKEVTGTLIAGQTSITLTDEAILTTSNIDPYTDKYGVNPTNVVATTGSVTLTFEAQATDLVVKVKVTN